MSTYERDFKGVWIPAKIWLSKELTLQEKVMMVEIDSLASCPKRGCWAGNEHFADFFGLSKSRVSEVISSLAKKGFIKVEFQRKGKQIVERNIFPLNPFGNSKGVFGKGDEPLRDPEDPPSGNAEENNTYFNNTESKDYSPKGEGDSLPAADDLHESEQIKPKAKKPRCPVNQIVDLYHEVLPELPEVKVLTDTRRKYIQARWNEKANRQTLDFWKRYFEYVRQSPFLMGQTEGTHGKPPFRADLEWLMRPSNFAKVIEEKYHA